jgi:hypothetical protein
MKKVSSILILLGISLFLYGLNNCACNKRIEKFNPTITPTNTPTNTMSTTMTNNINKKTEQIKNRLSGISAIALNNKYILDKTNKMNEDLKKIISIKK